MSPAVVALIVLVALVCVCMWTLRHRDQGLLPGRVYVSLAVFTVLIGVTLYVIYCETRASSELRQYISIYPNFERAVFVPAADGNSSRQAWMFKTTDQPKAILDFYRDKRNRQGWVLQPRGVGDIGSVALEKAGLRLIITAGQTNNETTVVYDLERL